MSVLFVAGGFWSSTVLAGYLATGEVLGRNLIAAVLYGVTGFAFMGIESLKYFFQKQEPGKAKAIAPWLFLAGYGGLIASMFLLKGWHNGAGVLIGFAVMLAASFFSLVLPAIVSWIKARFPKSVSSNGGAAGSATRAVSPIWEAIAGHKKATIWGFGAAGALISLIGLVFFADVHILALAPIAAIMLGMYLYNHATKVARRSK